MSSNIVNISGNYTLLDVCHNLPLFVPGSAGSYADLAIQTLYSANQCFPFLERLVAKTGKANLAIMEVEKFANHPSVASSTDATDVLPELKKLFDSYGSDKATAHNYHLMYGPILRGKNATGLLEIGLGTNNTDVVSHMGSAGRPGASLRAFRDFLPHASVYGADVDRRILFEEERIKTYFVDQTDLGSFDALEHAIPGGLDMVIDDGLHSPNANIAALTFGLGKVKENGWLIIEDIQTNSIPVWHVVAALLRDICECFLLKTTRAWVFAARKRAAA